MSTRRVLPQRRNSLTFNMDWQGLNRAFSVSFGRYDDGTVAEFFITGSKSGEGVESVARDGAMLASLAMQYGASLETLANAITRNAQGEPSSIIGAAIDQIRELEKQWQQISN